MWFSNGLQGKAEMVDKSLKYLELHLKHRQRPLTVAITTYALALAGSSRAQHFNTKLMNMSLNTPDGELLKGR